MDWELVKDIATIASPIIGAIAIGVALWISHRSSRDAQKQISELRKLVDVFMASQAPNMVEALQQYEQQLEELDEQIEDAEDDYNIVNPFYGLGGARIDDIEYEQKKRDQAQNIAALRKQRKAIETQIKLIKSFLKKQ